MTTTNCLFIYISELLHLVTNKSPPTSVFSFVCWGVGSSLVISRSVHMGQGQNQLSVSEFPLILLYVCLTCPQTVMLLACSAPVLRPHRAARGQRRSPHQVKATSTHSSQRDSSLPLEGLVAVGCRCLWYLSRYFDGLASIRELTNTWPASVSSEDVELMLVSLDPSGAVFSLCYFFFCSIASFLTLKHHHTFNHWQTCWHPYSVGHRIWLYCMWLQWWSWSRCCLRYGSKYNNAKLNDWLFF